MTSILYLTCIVLGCLPFAHSYPRGVPPSACGDMFPQGHRRDAQLGEAPFSIEFVPDRYAPGENVSVIIRGDGTNNTHFNGFFIQARNASCPDIGSQEPIGHFYIDKYFTNVRVMPCKEGDSTNNSVSHSSADVKQSVAMWWTSPVGGDVFFQATIVKSKEVFWTGVQSTVLRDRRMPDNARGEYRPCPYRKRLNQYLPSSASGTSFSALVMLGLIPLAKLM